MKITRRQLRRIIREQMTYDQRDSDRYDDPGGSGGWPAISPYDMGFDDFRNGEPDPLKPDNEEYMAGWKEAEADELAYAAGRPWEHN